MFDISTGEPAEVNGVRQTGLSAEDADDLADLLNHLEAQRKASTEH